MLVIESKTAKAGEQVQVGIWLDERNVYGLQFDIVYDSAALEFVSWDSTLAATTNPGAGRFRFAVARDGTQEPLPEYIGSLVFNVSGPSALSIVDVVAGDSTAQAVSLSTQDGAVTIEEYNVNFEAYWDAPPSSLGVTGTKVFVGNSADKNDGTFQQVADIASPGTVAPFSLDANQGDRYAYCFHYDAQGDTGPDSSVVSFSTDAALPAPSGFGIRVV
jgi:hypothetical protein